MNKPRRREDDPLVQWKAKNRLDERTANLITLWLYVAIATEKALVIEEALEGWLDQPLTPAPDLVQCVGLYGYVLTSIADWKRVPVDIPDDDLDRWRESGYRPTMTDIYDRLAGVAGGFLELAGDNPKLVIEKVLKPQLEVKVSQLESQLDELVTALENGYRTDDFDDEEYLDGADSDEWHWFERPLLLRQQLDGFEIGMEHLRMLCVEDNPELGLPNFKLQEALRSINLNVLLAKLRQADIKLRRMLSLLAERDYYKLDLAYEPKAYWWRHWREEYAKQGQRKK